MKCTHLELIKTASALDSVLEKYQRTDRQTGRRTDRQTIPSIQRPAKVISCLRSVCDSRHMQRPPVCDNLTCHFLHTVVTPSQPPSLSPPTQHVHKWTIFATGRDPSDDESRMTSLELVTIMTSRIRF